ncbi:MAG: Urease accessory protein UreD [Pseudomonadota bacterium]|jgi:urease accessory protein
MSWHAELELDYRRDARGATVLQHRHRGPLRIFKSLYPEGPAICHNVIIHPPGGLVRGDLLEIDLRLAEGAHALVSTPGATRFYRSDSGEPAEQRVRLRLEAGARLEWLPLETIVYEGCRARNRVELELASGAELMAWDLVSLGLPAAGSGFDSGSLEQHWEWPGVWLERARIDAADRLLLDSPLGLAGQRTLATLVLACGSPLGRERRERLLEHCRAVVEQHPLARRCGVTCPNERLLVVRALADQVEPLMQLWQSLWAVLRRQAWNLDGQAPRIWRV